MVEESREVIREDEHALVIRVARLGRPVIAGAQVTGRIVWRAVLRIRLALLTAPRAEPTLRGDQDRLARQGVEAAMRKGQLLEEVHR
jgi:hypothetical protein